MKNDTQFEEKVIKNVSPSGKDFTLEFVDGWSFFCPKYKQTPKPGDIARLYGRGTGFSVRGLSINGVKVFYRTKDQDKARFEKEQREAKCKKIKDFQKNKKKTDKRISLLPEPFINRLKGFHHSGIIDWRPNYEPYELFCCEQAVVIANAFNKYKYDALPSQEQKQVLIGKLNDFRELPCDKQIQMVPELSQDHSGNTFGMACRLAFLYLVNPELVEKEHGAMCPLVGCKEYGCFASRKRIDAMLLATTL